MSCPLSGSEPVSKNGRDECQKKGESPGERMEAVKKGWITNLEGIN